MIIRRISFAAVVVGGLVLAAGCNRTSSSGSDSVPVQATTLESQQANRQRGAETARQLSNMGKR
ncbi:hypothetical protein EON83_20055 [bacterium]|nr:MAG: hypothetical protein EON83_20055 [bacterium]